MIAALATHPKAVLFFPTETAAAKWSTTFPNPIVALEVVASLKPDGIAFDPSVVEIRLLDAGLVQGSVRKRPRRKRSDRACKIERLTKEVLEHLQAANENALSTKEITGTPALLPRPSQQDLAKRCGLTESDVTRCFQDDTARPLNLYWEMALDLDQVMKVRGPIR